MCGITGLWPRAPVARDETIQAAADMAKALAHRGPDQMGVWHAPDGPAFGFRRLAILDLTAAGAQPMSSYDGRFTVVFNGEIYNHKDLRRELEARGVVFRGHSDTEALVEAFAAWGIDATLPRLDGMFAIAAWHQDARTLRLARDPVGKKPLYYGSTPACLVFGSELRAIWAAPGPHDGVDRAALGRFLNEGFVGGSQSILRHVQKLPPGTSVAARTSDRFDAPVPFVAPPQPLAPASAPAASSDVALVEELGRRLGHAVQRRLESDVPLGAFLSGGVDSSLVVALMARGRQAPVRTFAIGFDDPAYDEAPYARAVAEHLGVEHHEKYVTAADVIAAVPKMASVYDEPLADPSQVPTFLVCAFARRHVTVALSGDGGDEFFGGYPWYWTEASRWERLRRVPAWSRALAARALASPSPGRWDMLYRALGGRRPFGRPGFRAHRLADALRARQPEDMVAALHGAWPTTWRPWSDLGPTGPDPAPPVPRSIRSPADRLAYRDQTWTLPGAILAKVDRASMSVGLEVRCPLLDRDLVAWSRTLPPTAKVRDGRGKWILRQLLSRHVPAAIAARPKKGFSVPLDAWLRGPLKDWAASLLDPVRVRREGLLDASFLRARWQEQLRGRNWGASLWPILTFQAWLEAHPAAAGSWGTLRSSLVPLAQP